MKLTFKNKYTEADNVVTFVFEPQEPVFWLAGQSIRIEVAGIYGPEERRFTISSASYEKSIHITTNISDSSYKQTLNNLQPGTLIDAYAIEGTFTWQNSNLPHLFIAGGVGITPFYAMLKQRLYDKKPPSATLLYGSSSNEFIFEQEFNNWQKQYQEFKAVYIASRHIQASDAKDFLSVGALVYVSGPSNMVNELSDSLQNMYKLPETNIKRDWFTGRVPG